MSLKFKTSDERNDWLTLGTKNKPLMELVIDLVEFCELMYSKDVTITDIYRLRAEEAELFHITPEKAPSSAHYSWEAVDLRSFTFTAKERADICEYLNLKYKNVNGRPVAFCHAIPGGAYHFHVQLYR